MKIRVLGSAAGGGFPQWNCNCPNCSKVRTGHPGLRARTQSSVAVSSDSKNWILFNASPDILSQLAAMPSAQPARSVRDTGIQAIVLIDAQIDHTTGLLMLREATGPLEIYCTEPVYQDLTQGNRILKTLSSYCGANPKIIKFADRRCEFAIPGFERLKFSAFPLKSKAPPYSPHREDPHEGDTIGVEIEDLDSGGIIFYAPGLGEIEEHLVPVMRRAHCLMVDGTFWEDDEMIKLGISRKRARDIGHLPQSGPGGMLQELEAFPQARKILIHVNNTNPILDETSGERALLTSAKIEVAFDGMEIEL